MSQNHSPSLHRLRARRAPSLVLTFQPSPGSSSMDVVVVLPPSLGSSAMDPTARAAGDGWPVEVPHCRSTHPHRSPASRFLVAGAPPQPRRPPPASTSPPPSPHHTIGELHALAMVAATFSHGAAPLRCSPTAGNILARFARPSSSWGCRPRRQPPPHLPAVVGDL
jgi:hypothetical protein